jgi:hypothetical protein
MRQPASGATPYLLPEGKGPYNRRRKKPREKVDARSAAG